MEDIEDMYKEEGAADAGIEEQKARGNRKIVRGKKKQQEKVVEEP
jgi:hypothetical protein